MNLPEIRDRFRSGQMSKPEYIDAMYEWHRTLFHYSALLPKTELKTIEITGEGILFVSVNDVRIFCDFPDKRTAPFEIMNFDSYEAEDAEILFRLIQPGDTVLDIGANIGWYTVNIAKKFPDASVISFEPVPATFKQLKKNVEINHVPNVKINNMGLSKSSGEVKFFLSPTHSVSASSVNIMDDSRSVEVTCMMTTLDEYVRNEKIRVDFIKCDVEGAELTVLEGGRSTIAADLPVLFLEMLRKWSAKFNYHPNDIIGLLKKFGYQCYSYHNGQLTEHLQITDETRETNFVFLHPQKHASLLESLVRK